HDRLRERSDARHLEDVLPVPLEPAGAVEHHPARGLMAVAENRAPDRAVEAAAALRTEREDDVIARLHVGDAAAYFLDDARRLVAEHHRQRQRPVAVHDVPVAVADARRLDGDPGLAGLGPLLLDVDDLERCVGLVEDRGFHVVAPWERFSRARGGAAPTAAPPRTPPRPAGP